VHAQASEFELFHLLGMLQGIVPFVAPDHGDGERLPRFDIDVNISALGRGVIHAAGVIVSGIELDRFIVSACPVEDSLLSIRGRGQDKAQEREAEYFSHMKCHAILRIGSASLTSSIVGRGLRS
jgi:hypothetical protein